MKNKTPKKVFVDGPIPPEKISKSIASHSTKLDIDGHSIFLAQVQHVQEDGTKIEGIDFSVDVEKAEALLYEIREETFSKFSLTCMHIYHSLGLVKPGELYLFIFTSSTDRTEAIKACDYLVNRIKAEVLLNEHRA
jgi:molybdopterin synthase catalytic subunit